jgi:hypothetical protein
MREIAPCHSKNGAKWCKKVQKPILTFRAPPFGLSTQLTLDLFDGDLTKKNTEIVKEKVKWQ